MHRSGNVPHGDLERHATWRAEVRQALDAAIDASVLPKPLQDAIRYGSTEPQASRWRALLALEVGRALGTDPQAALRAAVAAEALHCATLSIDDLPSMDDAAERRGLPAMHRRFNEAMAIQASLWLLGISRTMMASAAATAGGPSEVAARLAALQQRTEDELQIGQFMDMLGSLGKMQVDGEHVARLKCGRLFALAAQASGWLAPGRSESVVAALDRFGEEVGLAYQIRDDLDDLAEDAAASTWAAGDERGRPTAFAADDREGAHRAIEACLERAVMALGPVAAAGVDVGPLVRMAVLIFGRG
jgi:geranylgeranyl diphosphate synthase type II